MPLTHARVHTIRTVPKTDRHYGALYRVPVQTIRRARIGETWADHPTLPDTKPRVRTGTWGDL